MSGQLTAKLRLVRCPKCRLVLPELPQYNVYKCGGCGTTLQAKKRKNDVNPESHARETDAAPTNTVNPVSEDKECSNGEQPVLHQEKVLRTKTTSSSSGECSLDGDGGSSQNENGECNGKQLVLPQENVVRTKRTSSSSGECSLDANGGRDQNENGECDKKQLALPQQNVLTTKTTSSSSGECSLDGDGGSSQNENGECNEKQLVLPQENVVRTKRTSASSGECSLDVKGGRDQNKNGEYDEKQLALPQQNVLRTKSTSSSSGEYPFLDVDGGREHNENGECNGKQLVLSQEKVWRTKSTSSSSGECSLDVNGDGVQIGNEECNGKKIILPQGSHIQRKATSFSSGEFSLDENGSRGNHIQRRATSFSSGECSLDETGSREQNNNGECNGEQLVLPQEKVWMTKSRSSSSGECSLDVNGGGVQIGDEECNGKKITLPQGSHIQRKATGFSSGECSLNENGSRGTHIQRKATSFSSGECSLDENGSREQNNNGECNGEQLDLPRENSQRTKSTSFSSGECFLNGIGGRDKNGEFNVAFNLSEEDLENEMDSNNLSDIRFKKRKVSSKGCLPELSQTKIEASSVSMEESPVGETNDNHLQLAGAEGSDNGSLLLKEAEEQLIGASDGVDANDDKSAQTEAKSEVEITGSDDPDKSLTNDNFASGRRSISGNPVSTPNKQMKQAQEPKHHTFDASEVMNQSSELSGDLGELSKSPTTRSSHAYDGSVSSYDGVDKRFPDQHLNPFENTYNVANAVSEGRHRKGKGPITSMNVPSDLPRGKHYVMKDTKKNQHDRPARHWSRAGTEGYPPSMPFHRSGSQSGYESDIPSNQMPDDEQYFSSSSFLSPDYRQDSNQEKMKLLRMIYKLQNQLNRTSSLKGETSGRISTSVSYKGKHVSASHSHDFLEGRRFSHDLSDPWSDATYRHEQINWRQRSKLSRIPFSAESSSSTHHVDNSCFHCRQRERRYSVELPPHVLCQHEELCRYRPGHNSCCFSHHSYPSSAQRYMGSKLRLYGRETKSDDQRRRAQEMRMYFREKKNMDKRYFRPIAGGAPFVTCRNCFNLLQLPADFLLFKRVCHQLKCGHCSEILKFSLEDRSHIVSYEPNELDDHSEVINGSTNMASSASHPNYFHSSHAVPISYSDDYGNYVSKSYSSEGDPVSLTPFHPLHGSEYDTNVSRGASDEEEKIAPKHSRTRKAPLGTYESIGVSSNMSGSEKLSSEMEAPPPPPRSSPLHQLMGYSSPSQVIRGL